LVELLTVVAIVALLTGLVGPSLVGAKNMARRTLCAAQLRQWGLAFSAYAVANHGFWPHIDGLDRDASSADRCGWVDVLPPLLGERPWRDHDYCKRPGRGTLFQCPSASLLDTHYGYRPERSGYFSYAMNSCLELDIDCYRAPGDGGVAMPSFLRVDKVVEPARTVLLFDQSLDPHEGYGGLRLNRSAGQYCGSYPKDFGARHPGSGGLGGAVLYCDSSVRFVGGVWKDGWPPDMHCPPRDDQDWFPYPARP